MESFPIITSCWKHWQPWFNWNIFESRIRHHNPSPKSHFIKLDFRVAQVNAYYIGTKRETRFVTKLTRRVSLVEQELPTLLEHLSSPPVFSGVRVTRSLVLYVLCIVVCPFVLFLLAIVLSVLLRNTDSDYPFGIFKLFIHCYAQQNSHKADTVFHQRLQFHDTVTLESPIQPIVFHYDANGFGWQ